MPVILAALIRLAALARGVPSGEAVARAQVLRDAR
jgi:hypothetical protein